VAASILAASTLEGSTLESGWAAITQFVKLNQWTADPIAFALGYAESIIFFSWFLPSSILLVALGGVHGAAGGNLVLLWLSASLGAFLGDVSSYWMGHAMKSRVAQIWPLSSNPDWLPKAHDFIERWGMLGVVLGKFVGPLRPFIPLASGVAEMALPKFLIASAVSSLIWAGAFLLPGMFTALWFLD
jgi:membrane protein DedA with SNARE-associated domain